MCVSKCRGGCSHRSFYQWLITKKLSITGVSLLQNMAFFPFRGAVPLDEPGAPDVPGAGLVEAEGSYRLEKVSCQDSSAVLLLQENT